MSIDVCICTHNPRLELFTIILTAIANQTLSKDAYQVWIIDNASNPPISNSDLAPLAQAGITYYLLQEPRLGTMYARELASQAIPGEALILVDDDNELSPNYLEIAIEILDRCPEIGYFGGKLLSGIKVDYPQWMEELLPYLGIKNLGDEPISKCIEGDYYWGEWEPPCAGAVIRKVVLQQYFKNLQKLAPNLVLGRRGKQGLLSMADSWLANCAYELGLECAYQPRLQLIHHINPERLQFEYLFKLLYNYGRSDVILKKILDRPIRSNSIESIAEKIEWWQTGGISIGYFICLMALEAGFNAELSCDNSIDFVTLLEQAFQQKLTSDLQELVTTQQTLTITQQELTDDRQELTAIQQTLTITQQELTVVQQTLTITQQELNAAQQELSDARAQIRLMEQSKFRQLLHSFTSLR
ncbi:glycosyltransferase [Chamaesiphon sp. VAR_48_metabat_135_sub]|uniref:glycosyltransferase n=1 Tax=Chamaesiphon sp. VAR_48_metabat_135_sub TaxID=2964699 RepID=UPI00286C2DD4|nr:glycosyltransferase [Chamaesiphon sp. VAR_48_metabat_135_sub]